MKKLLLSCFLALGIGVGAQVLVHESFEGGGTAYTGFTTTSLSNYSLTGSACEATLGKQALGRALSSAATTAVLEYNSSTAGVITNGKKIDVSVKNQQWGTTLGGNIKLEYAVGTSTTFTAVPGTSTVAFTAQTSCQTISGTIPEGTIAAGTAVKIRVTTTWTSGSFVALYDAIDIVQEVTSIPSCTTFTAPANAATGVSVRPAITWGAASGAEYYKLKIGTAAGASDVVNIQVSGTNYRPASTNVLPQNTLLYASVTPTNVLGDATGCASEISFTTGANPYLPFCGPILSSTTATYPISSVTLAGVTNTSSATTGEPAHENFTSTVFELAPNSSNTINIVGTGLGTNRFAAVVFIDWNNNGSFADSGETYFNTSPFLYGFTAPNNTLNGTITVPSSALLDTNVRMRIKYNYVGTTNPTSLPAFMTDPCADLGNGQAEDYTVVVKAPTTPPACTTFISPTHNQSVASGATTISWNPSTGALGYKLTVGTTSGASDVFTGTVTGTSQVVTLSGVGVTYYAKVVPTNSVGDATGCTEISFMTCSAVSVFPLNMSFDTNSTPACWANESVSGTAKWTFVTANGNASITPQSAPYMAEFRTTNAGDKARLITVPLDITSLTNPVLKFSYANVNWFGDIDELRVFYKTSASGAWTQIGTDYITENTAWKTITLDLPNKSSEYYIAFEGTSNWARGINLDDVSIYEGPTAAVSNVNKNQVTVYPNPFTDILKISDVKNIKSISVSDISGRQVKTLAPAAELNLSSLKAGLYIVNLHMNDGTVKAVKAIKK